MAVDSTGSALNAQINSLQLEDSSKDMTSNKAKVSNASGERKEMNKRIEQAQQQAEKAKAEAKKWEAEANGTGFLGSVFGKKASRARKAAEAGHKMESLNNQAQRTEVDMKSKGKAMEDALEKLQNSLSTLDQGKQDIESFQKKATETFEVTEKVAK